MYGPEVTKLKSRLKDAHNFNVFWGPKAHTLTAEQRAAEINKAFDQVERGDCEAHTSFPKSKHPRVDVRDYLLDRELETCEF